jgi:hypothetical protein
MKDFVYNQIKQEIINFSNLMKKKRITDKHLMYLFNTLILLKIEYRAQTIVFFLEKENDNLMKPFRKMFKNKLSFAWEK